MQGLNRAYLIGTVAMVEVTDDATTIIEIVTPYARKAGGEWTEGRVTHRLSAAGSEAEFLAKHARKGDLLAVEAAIIPTATVKNGRTSYEVRLRLDRVLSLSSKHRD